MTGGCKLLFRECRIWAAVNCRCGLQMWDFLCIRFCCDRALLGNRPDSVGFETQGQMVGSLLCHPRRDGHPGRRASTWLARSRRRYPGRPHSPSAGRGRGPAAQIPPPSFWVAGGHWSCERADCLQSSFARVHDVVAFIFFVAGRSCRPVVCRSHQGTFALTPWTGSGQERLWKC
jgi:hypothetical protein